MKEYQPRAPPQPRPQQDGPPKAKKRAQLLPVSSSGTLSSGRSSPAIKGMLMGSDLAKFEDSDVILEVAGCGSQQVSVCRSLASMLKEHQKEGLQFCWKNVWLACCVKKKRCFTNSLSGLGRTLRVPRRLSWENLR